MAEQKSDCSSFAVIYYPFGGRAEPLRYAAALGGISFEDRFITQEQQKKDKAEGKRRWCGPPELVAIDKDGKDLVTIGQSSACLRYVGKLAGIYPDNKVDAALADEILDSCEDLAGVFMGAMAGKEKEEEKKEAMGELLKEGGKFRYWADKFLCRQQEAEKRGVKSGLLVGEAITIAELKFSASFGYLVNNIPPVKQLLEGDKYKPLLAIREKVEGNDKIKAFNEQFKKNLAAFKEKPENATFKYAGTAKPGAL
eukprot:CAMPEP_0201565712 /NCGR_PEP_ID=MMETSP0190_2-20130828/5034_1 /ASSEMBLY_ACC=CAM_ASM_000263 /TAXON_ID=37353 /ORGANISM="Rosalina sp." /LENGTH=253 /DNA_ID=CAMNT_0047983533 /DNA_START=105 /DNA_END=866 /DNA_ORIENTATION=-